MRGANIAFALAAVFPVTLGAGPSILDKRIVGKGQATEKYRFTVSIQEPNGDHFCGGSLLDSTTVLTAAHCVTKNILHYSVLAGTRNLDTGGVKRNISSVQRTSDGEVDLNSSDHSKPLAVDDIAILKLETPISECHGVEYAVLPADGSDPTADSEAVAVGWGQQTPLQESGNGEDVKERAEVTLTVHPRETCSQNRPLVGDRDTIVCAGGNGKGVCKGGSGGPLVDLQTGELIGISSFILNTTQGLTCGQAPAVFTRIGSFIPFINKNLGTSGYGGAETERLIEAPKVRDIGNKMYNACTGRVFYLRDKCPAGNEKCESVIDGLEACVKCMKAAKIDKSSSQVLQETYEEKKKQVFSCLDRELDVEDI